MFFYIFISLLTSIGASAFVFPLIIRAKFVSLPRSFVATQLAFALLARPLVDLATYIWHLRPVYAILSSLPPLIFALFSLLFYSYASVVFRKVFSNFSTAVDLLEGRLAFFSPFDIKENVKESWNVVITSVKDFLATANYTEIFQNVEFPEMQPQQWFGLFSGLRNSFESGMKTPPGYDYFAQVQKNLTISDHTQQYVDTVNVAVIGFLENVQPENILNATRIPSDLYAPLHKVTEAIHLLAKELNFTVILKDGTTPSSAQDLFNQFGSALQTTVQGIDLKELYETTVFSPASELDLNSSEKVKLLSLLRNPLPTLLSDVNLDQAWLWREATYTFVTSAWRYILLFILPLFVVTPLVFVLRAALQDGCLWLVTRRYKFVIPSEQRSVSGWMFVAAISGLAWAVTEAFPSCCIFFYVHFSTENTKTWLIVSLILHTLTGAPLRTASHMRLAEGIAHNDILTERESGLRKGMIIGALFNGLFSMWWLLSSTSFLLLPLTTPPFVSTILTDVLIASFSIAWGRRICRRVVEKEQRWKEDRERKQD